MLISEDAEFFLAICSYHLHSFIALGVKDKNKKKILCALGKQVDDKRYPPLFVCNLILGGSAHSYIFSESFIFKTTSGLTLRYKAYAISYSQYLEFLSYLKALDSKQSQLKKERRVPLYAQEKLYAYCPHPQNKNFFEWSALSKYEVVRSYDHEKELNREVRHFTQLSSNNTCRHSSLAMAAKAAGRDPFGLGVSSFFFRSMPLVSNCIEGEFISTHFYILPMPPTAFEVPPDNQKILYKLYKRLDKMVLIEQDNPLTKEKFEKLKQLYVSLTKDLDLSILHLIKSIQTWEQEHAELISRHRRYHWFTFKTATQRLFEELHQEFESVRVETPGLRVIYSRDCGSRTPS